MTESLDPIKKPTLSLPEAAEVLGISRHTLYSLAKSDASPIPILRFGKRYCVPTARLLEFLRQGPAPMTTATSTASTQVDAKLVAGSAQGAELVAVIERQTAELRRVGDLLEQLVDQGLRAASEPSGPVGGDPDELLDAEQAAKLLGGDCGLCAVPALGWSRWVAWGAPGPSGSLAPWRPGEVDRAWPARWDRRSAGWLPGDEPGAAVCGDPPADAAAGDHHRRVRAAAPGSPAHRLRP
jgi:excisionase family DNA binding protein